MSYIKRLIESEHKPASRDQLSLLAERLREEEVWYEIDQIIKDEQCPQTTDLYEQ